ncbi:VWA domain-containing protein [Octadecabacter sp. G9-8]|uniref:VWA domain-containing protein n=1 Tax=Octadecabacter dasysiphoniae TaxID=2909341 RepID=A0ABS9D0C0_9RHOB|nr:vWA domain-containing protein [Octadecabacter dasysiphoniae]MCF2872055.1 VWA domain-containing protein [Octadecabacter dasysiphoniae]
MQFTTRTFFTCALVGLMPLTANAQMQTVEEVAQAIDQFAVEIEAAEAVPFVEGSEGAAQRQLDELRAALQNQEEAMNTTAGAIAAAQNTILAALPAFPQAVVQPEAPVEPVPNQEPDQVPEPEIPMLTDWTTTGQPALTGLVSPLAYNERARRVLSRPGARLQDEAGNFTPLPAFSVFYVYAEGMSGSVPILAVGRGTRGAEGWVQASQTEDWRTMLVMSYAPNTGRDRTVFFASQNDVFDVLDLEEGSGAAIRSIHTQIEEGSYNPDKIVAIEPALTVNSVERPYLMPVLDFVQTSTETHGDVTILQLAALNRDSTDISTAGAQPVGEDRITTEADARDLKVGVAFVIDTTRSMGPYIDRTQDFVRDISFGLSDRGLQDQFDFALVGFRDNVGAGQDVEYLRRVYRDFGGVSSRGSLFADVEDMQPAAASTANWREDAFAGIDLAIGGLNWGEVNTRLVFLITDASPRSVGDALASDSRMGPETINALAAQRNISLFVLHMQTEEAASVSQSTEGYDDTARGQQLYARLSQTGDAAISKYFSVQGQTEKAFADSLNLVAGLVIDQLSELSLTGRLTQPQALFDDPLLDAVNAGGPVVIEDEGDAPLIAAAVAGELFRYQTEYLGARSGVEAPDFYRGWAVDKDIANPDRRSLEVSVFVTRDQLSDLANRLGDIVTRLREKDLGMADFFSSVQAEAGSTAVDPSFGSFLPSYLDDLPYGSKFINMTPGTWADLGQTSREQLLNEVTAKLASYNRIYATQDGWITLDERSTEDQVYPLPLRDLP